MKINELRRSSSIIPKKSGIDSFVEYISSLSPEDIKRTFISFTKIDKLGINPKSVYDTPLGIYAYPVDYVLNSIKDAREREPNYTPKFRDVVPFAGSAPFFNVFQVEGNVVELNNQGQCSDAIQKLCETHNIESVNLPHDYQQSSVARKFWSLSLFIANGKSGTVKTNQLIAKRWNSVFRKAGIYGVVDREGYGIIHPNEPCQAVFFTSEVVKNVKRFLNTQNSGSSVKQPLKTKKIGNYFAKRILQYPGLVGSLHKQVNEIWMFRALARYDVSGDSYALSTKAERIEMSIQRDLRKALDQVFSSQNVGIVESKLSEAVDESLYYYIRSLNINRIETEVDSTEAVRKATLLYITPDRRRMAWKTFVASLIKHVEEAIKHAQNASPEFSKWIEQTVPTGMRD